MKRIISIVLSMVFVLSISMPAFSADTTPKVTLNGKTVTLKNAPYKDGDMWMLPFKETLGHFNIEIKQNEETGLYEGEVNQIDISVKPDSYTSNYDLVPFELEHYCKSVEDDVYIQFDFLQKIYEVTSSYADDRSIRLTYTPPPPKEEFDLDAYIASYPVHDEVLSIEELGTEESMNKPENTKFKAEWVDVSGNPDFDKAIRLESLVKQPSYIYEQQLLADSKIACELNDVLILTFWARTIVTADESARAKCNVCFEANKDPWEKSLCTDISIGSDWTRYQLVFKMLTTQDAGTMQFGLRFLHHFQTFEVADLTLINYGKGFDTSHITLAGDGSSGEGKLSRYTPQMHNYYGREEDALWREEAFKRIEKYRVKDINVNVTDEQGKPVKDAKVKADMTKSEFHWGSLYQPMFSLQSGQLGLLYDDLFIKNFNTATFNTIGSTGYYNSDVLNDRNNVHVQSPLSANLFRENDIDVRYHNLIWDTENFMGQYLTFSGKTVDDITEQEIIEYYVKHASRTLYEYGDVFYEMDIVNEPVAWNTWYEKYGVGWMVKVMNIVEDICDDIGSDMKFIVNDIVNGDVDNWNRPKALRERIEEYINAGAKIDGVGFEDHFISLTYPQLLYNQAEYVAENLETMSITEYDYNPLVFNDEAIKAEEDFFRDLMIMAYSQPKMTSFVMWGFSDHWHWQGNAPLYDDMFLPKTNQKTWENLTQQEWWTNTGGNTDENGQLKMRGHRGDYKVTVEVDGKKAETTLLVTKDGENTVNAVVTEDGITLTSSEEVPPKKTKVNYVMEGREREVELENMWRKLYENKITKVTACDGRDVSFLKNDEDSHYTLKKTTEVTAQISEPIENGYVSVTVPQSETLSVCSVYGRLDDGEWQYIGNFGSGDEKYIGYNGTYNQFKVTTADNDTVNINKIHISKKEPKI